MKLHLPKSLRTALLSCLAAISPWSLTLASGAISVGAVVFSLGAQAQDETISITTDTNWDATTNHSAYDTTVSGSGTELKVGNGSGGAGNMSANSTVNLGTLTLEDAATLNLWAWTARDRDISTDGKVKVAGAITLDNSSIWMEDGSYYFSDVLNVNGTSTITSRWNKGIVLDAISGDADAELTLCSYGGDPEGALFVLGDGETGNSSFNGTLVLKNNVTNQDAAKKTPTLVLNDATALQTASLKLNGYTNAILQLERVSAGAVYGAGDILITFTNQSDQTVTGNAAPVLQITGNATEAQVFSGTTAAGVTWQIGDGTTDASSRFAGATLNGTLDIKAGSTAYLTGDNTFGTLTNNGTLHLSEGSSFVITSQAAYQGATITGLGVISGISGNTFEYGNDWEATYDASAGTATLDDVAVYWVDAATDGNIEWSDASNWSSAAVPPSNQAVRLTADNAGKEISVSGNVTVKELRVYGSYTLNVSGSFASVDGYNFFEGGSITKTGAGTLNATLADAPSIIVNEGTLKITERLDGDAESNDNAGAITYEADFTSLNVGANGTLAINAADKTGNNRTTVKLSDSFAGTLEIVSGYVDTDSAFSDATIKVNGGGLLSRVPAGDITNNVVIGENGATFYSLGSTGVDGTWKTKFTGTFSGSGTLTIQERGDWYFAGDMSGFTGSIVLNTSYDQVFFYSSASVSSFSATKRLDGNATVYFGDGTKAMEFVVNDAMTVSEDTHFAIASGASFKNKNQVTISGGKTLKLTESGAYNMDGWLNMGSGAKLDVQDTVVVSLANTTQTINAGEIAIASGAKVSDSRVLTIDGDVRISGAGTYEQLGSLTINAGKTLTLSGDVTLSSLTNNGTITFDALNSLTLKGFSDKESYDGSECYAIGNVTGGDTLAWNELLGMGDRTVSYDATSGILSLGGVPVLQWADTAADDESAWGEASNWQLSGGSSHMVPLASSKVLLSADAQYSDTVTLTGDVTVDTLTVARNHNLSVAEGVSATLSATTIALENGATLSKTGEGTLSMSSANAIAAKMHITAGTLALTDEFSFTLGSGYNGNYHDLSAITADADGVLQVDLNGTYTNAGCDASAVKLSDEFRGALSVVEGQLLVKKGSAGTVFGGAAELHLNQAALYFDDEATVSVPKLVIGADDAYITNRSTATISSAISGGGSLTVQADDNGKTLTLTGAIDLDGVFTQNKGTLILDSSTKAQFDGGVVLNANGTININSAADVSSLQVNGGTFEVKGSNAHLTATTSDLNTKITVKDSGKADLGAVTTAAGIQLDFLNGAAVTMDSLSMEGNLTLHLNEGSSLTIGKEGVTGQNEVIGKTLTIHVWGNNPSSLTDYNTLVVGENGVVDVTGMGTYSVAGLTQTGGEIKLGTNGKIQLNGVVTLSNISNSGTLDLSGVSSLSLVGFNDAATTVDGTQTFTLGTVQNATEVAWNKLTGVSIGERRVKYSGGTVSYEGADATYIVWADTEDEEYAWGEDSNWRWADDRSLAATPTSANKVQLTADAANKSISMSGSATVGELNVQGAYDLDVAAGAVATLTATTITVGEGGKLSKTGDGTLTMSKDNAVTGKLHIENGALKLSDAFGHTLTTGVTQSGGINYSLAGITSSASGVLQVDLDGGWESNSLDATALALDSDFLGILEVVDGQLLVKYGDAATDGKSDFGGASAIRLNKGAIFFQSNTDYNGPALIIGENGGNIINRAPNTTIAASITGTGNLGIIADGSKTCGLTFTGVIDLDGKLSITYANHTLTVNSATKAQFNGGFLVNGGVVNINSAADISELSVTGGTFNINGAEVNIASLKSGSLTLTGAADLTAVLADAAQVMLTGAATADATLSVVTGGSATLSVAESLNSLTVTEGGALALTGALTLGDLYNTGSLDIAGLNSLSIGGLALVDGAEYEVGSLTGTDNIDWNDLLGLDGSLQASYDGSKILLSISDTPVLWVGDAGSTWDEVGEDGASTAWQQGGAAFTPGAKSAVVLGNAASLGELNDAVTRTIVLDADTVVGSVTVQDEYSFSVAEGETYSFDANSIVLEAGGSLSKVGAGTLSMSVEDAVAAKMTIAAGTLSLSDTLADYNAGTRADLTALSGSGTLSITAAGTSGATGNGTGQRTAVNLADTFTGTLAVVGGNLDMASTIGRAGSVLLDGATLVGTGELVQNLGWNIAVGDNGAYLRRFGNAGYDERTEYATRLTGTLTGSAAAMLRVIDSGEWFFAGDMSGYQGGLSITGDTNYVTFETNASLASLSAVDGSHILVDNGATLTAPALAVNGTIYTGATEGATLNLGTVTINDASVLSVSGGGVHTASSVAMSAATTGLTLGDHTTLTVTGALNGDENADAETLTLTLGSGAKLNLEGTGHVRTIGSTVKIVLGDNAVLTDAAWRRLGNSSLSITGTGVYNLAALQLSNGADADTSVSIGAGATLHITGTTNNHTGDGGAFLTGTNNYNNTITVSGTLALECGVSRYNIDDTANTINVESGGKIAFNRGLTAANEGGAAAKDVINIKGGGVLEVSGTNVTGTNLVTVIVENEAKIFGGTANGATESVIANDMVIKHGFYVGAAAGTTLTLAPESGSFNFENSSPWIDVLGTAAGLGGKVVFDVDTLQLNALKVYSGAQAAITSDARLYLNEHGGIVVNQGGILSFDGAGEITLGQAIKNAGSVEILNAADTQFVLNNALLEEEVGVSKTWTLVNNTGMEGLTGTITGWDTLGLENFLLDGSALQQGNWDGYSIADGKVMLYMLTRYWDATGEDGVWNTGADANWREFADATETVTFETNSRVTFTDTDETGAALDKSVTVADAGVHAKSVTITGTGYEFSGGKVLVNQSLSAQQNASFDSAVVIGSSAPLQLDVADGATLTLSTLETVSTQSYGGVSYGSGAFSKTGAGTLLITDAINGTITGATVSGGKLQLGVAGTEEAAARSIVLTVGANTLTTAGGTLENVVLAASGTVVDGVSGATVGANNLIASADGENYAVLTDVALNAGSASGYATLKDVSFAGNSSLQGYITFEHTKKATGMAVAADSTLTIGDLTLDLHGLSSGDKQIIVNDGTIKGWQGVNLVYSGVVVNSAAADLSTDGWVKINTSVTNTDANLYWDGLVAGAAEGDAPVASSAWDKSSANWSDEDGKDGSAAFLALSNTYFGATPAGGSTAVNAAQDMVMANMFVTEGGYSFTGSRLATLGNMHITPASGAVSFANDLVAQGNVTLSAAQGGSVILGGALQAGGTITATGEGALSFNSTVQSGGDITLTGNGVVTLAGNVSTAGKFSIGTEGAAVMDKADASTLYTIAGTLTAKNILINMDASTLTAAADTGDHLVVSGNVSAMGDAETPAADGTITLLGSAAKKFTGFVTADTLRVNAAHGTLNNVITFNNVVDVNTLEIAEDTYVRIVHADSDMDTVLLGGTLYMDTVGVTYDNGYDIYSTSDNAELVFGTISSNTINLISGLTPAEAADDVADAGQYNSISVNANTRFLTVNALADLKDLTLYNGPMTVKAGEGAIHGNLVVRDAAGLALTQNANNIMAEGSGSITVDHANINLNSTTQTLRSGNDLYLAGGAITGNAGGVGLNFVGSSSIHYTGNSTVSANMTVATGSALTVASGSALTVEAGKQVENTLTLSGSISGAGNITMQGDGRVLLSGANTAYTGAVTVQQQTGLKLGHVDALAGATLNLAADGTLLVDRAAVGAPFNIGTLNTIAHAPVTLADGTTLTAGTIQIHSLQAMDTTSAADAAFNVGTLLVSADQVLNLTLSFAEGESLQTMKTYNLFTSAKSLATAFDNLNLELHVAVNNIANHVDSSQYKLVYDATANVIAIRTMLGNIWDGGADGDGIWAVGNTDKNWTGKDYDESSAYNDAIFADLTGEGIGESAVVNINGTVNPGEIYFEADNTKYELNAAENGAMLATGNVIHKAGKADVTLNLANNGTAANALGGLELQAGATSLAADLAVKGEVSVAAGATLQTGAKKLLMVAGDAAAYTAQGTYSGLTLDAAGIAGVAGTPGTVTNGIINGAAELNYLNLTGNGTLTGVTIGSGVNVTADSGYTLNGHITFLDTLQNAGTVTLDAAATVEIGGLGYTYGVAASDEEGAQYGVSAGGSYYMYQLVQGGTINGMTALTVDDVYVNGVKLGGSNSGLADGMAAVFTNNNGVLTLSIGAITSGENQPPTVDGSVGMPSWDERWGKSDAEPALSRRYAGTDAQTNIFFAENNGYLYGAVVKDASTVNDGKAVVVTLSSAATGNRAAGGSSATNSDHEIWMYDRSGFKTVIAGQYAGGEVDYTQTADTHVLVNSTYDGADEGTAVDEKAWVVGGSWNVDQSANSYVTMQDGQVLTLVGGSVNSNQTGTSYVYIDGGRVFEVVGSSYADAGKSVTHTVAEGETLASRLVITGGVLGGLASDDGTKSVYGGGIRANITGDIHVTVDGTATITNLVGGNYAGSVDGDITLDLVNGTANTVNAAGAGSSTVTCDVNVYLSRDFDVTTGLYGGKQNNSGVTVSGTSTLYLSDAGEYVFAQWAETWVDDNGGEHSDPEHGTHDGLNQVLVEGSAVTIEGFDVVSLAQGTVLTVDTRHFDRNITGDPLVITGNGIVQMGGVGGARRDICLENGAIFKILSSYTANNYSSPGIKYADYSKLYVTDGTTFDISGYPRENSANDGGGSISYHVYLSGDGVDGMGALYKGATDKNNSTNPSGKAALGYIELTGNASATAEHNIAMIGPNNATTYLDLNGYTFTKRGEGAYVLRNTEINGGTYYAHEGTVQPEQTSTGADADLVLAAAATLKLNDDCNFTMRSLTGAGDTELGAFKLTLAPVSGGKYYAEFMDEANSYDNLMSGTGFAYGVYSGKITGAGSLYIGNKTDTALGARTGVQYLSGTDSTYSGGTHVEAGRLYLLSSTQGSISKGGSEVTSGPIGTGALYWDSTKAEVYLGHGVTVYNAGGTNAAGSDLILGVEGAPDGDLLKNYPGVNGTVVKDGVTYHEVDTHNLQSISCDGVYADGTAYVAGTEIDRNKMLLVTEAAWNSESSTVKGFTDTGYNEATYSGVLSGEASLVKVGAGTLVIDQANAYTGDTDIQGGTLKLKGWAQIGSAADGTIDVTQTDGTSLMLAYDGTYGDELSSISNNMVLTGTGDQRWKGSEETGGVTAALISDVGSGVTFTLSGDISGEGNLLHSGEGTLVLSGDSSFSGGMHATRGVVEVQSATGLGAGVVKIESTADLHVTVEEGTTDARVATTLATAGTTVQGDVVISGTESTERILNVATGGYDNSSTTLHDNGTLLVNGAGVAASTGTLSGTGTVAVSDATGTGAKATVGQMTAYTGDFVVEGNNASITVENGNYSGGSISVSGNDAVLSTKGDITITNGESLSLSSRGNAGAEAGAENDAAYVTTTGSVSVASGATLSVSDATTSYEYNLQNLQAAASLNGVHDLVSGATTQTRVDIANIQNTEHVYKGAFNTDGAMNQKAAGAVDAKGGLTMASGATYETAMANTSLMGGSLTLESGLTLSTTLDLGQGAIDGAGRTTQLVLFSDVNSVNFVLDNLTAVADSGIYYTKAENYISGSYIDENTWLVYDSGAGVVYLDGIVPEPTTATLSLLALAALAARRRRR